ncbi:MAG: class A beta-lactamase-related serine hydrolase, partial [Candidatus Daviesbacteria bacterium]|nr:class A beta-lactamase-related serine hydrolase [Candidatus Daviesbacteria bacterium]
MNDGRIYSYIDRLKRRRRRKKLTGIFSVAIIALILGFGIYQFLRGIPPGSDWKQNILSVQTKNEPLKVIIDEALKGTQGSYGIAIINLKTGESFFFNEQKNFEIGSLYKLWIMALVYQDIREEKLSLDDSLTGDIATLNR